MKTRNIFGFCIFFLFFVSLTSCTKQYSLNDIQLDPTPIVSTKNRFALVIDPYISLKDKPDETGITVTHARRGDVFSVERVSIQQVSGDLQEWYNIGSGWVLETSISLYSSKEKALSAAKKIK